MGSGKGGSGTEVACRHVALIVSTHDDTVLTELEAPAQNSILQSGPHLGKGEGRKPSEGGMAGRIGTVIAEQLVHVILSPHRIVHLRERT